MRFENVRLSNLISHFLLCLAGLQDAFNSSNISSAEGVSEIRKDESVKRHK